MSAAGRTTGVAELSGPIIPESAPSRLGWVDRIGLWINASRRHGPGDKVLTQRHIYILPSKAGLLYATVLFAMLFASMNYQLSMGYALTFLLAGIAIVSIFHTFRNLSGLTLRGGRVEAVHCGQIAEFTVMIGNPTKLERHAIRLFCEGMSTEAVVDVGNAAEQLVSIAVPTARRGWLDIPRLKIYTRFPIGVWCAWAYWQPAMRVLVLPTPESPPAMMPEYSAFASEGDGKGKGEDDVAAIRPYQVGDSMRRIAWKAVARTATDDLLTKQFDGGDRGELLFDWRMLPSHLDTEARLSRLTRWVVDADSAGTRYALNIPGFEAPLDHSPEHRARCLEALALFAG